MRQISISITKTAIFRCIFFSCIAALLYYAGRTLQPELHREFWEAAFLWREPITAGTLCGVTLAILGVYILLNRIVFVSLALAQGAGLGIFLLFWTCTLLGYHLEHSFLPFLFGLLFASIVSLLFAWLKRFKQFSEESLIGLLYVMASGGILILGDHIAQGLHDLNNLLFGNAVAVTSGDLKLLLSIMPPLILIHLLFRRQFLYSSADPVFLQTLGMKVRPWRILLYFLFTIAITASLKVLGALPTFALLLIPPFIALHRANGVFETFWISALLGAYLPGLAYYYSYLFSFPTGASLIFISSFFLLAHGLEFLLFRQYGKAKT